MSLSNQSASAENPVSKYVKFKGGQFVYWDGEKEVAFNLPFNFIVLDQLSCITGYDESANKSIYSNEVRTTKDELSVRSDHELVSGVYKDIKDTIKAKGGRFTASVYAAVNGEIVNIKLAGAALSAWLDKDFKPVGVTVKELLDGKKGATTYKIPVFEPMEVSDKELEEAKALDVKLQEYLDMKLEPKEEKPNNDADFPDVITTTAKAPEVEDLPF